MQATETLCHLSVTDMKKRFCNVWFFCKNEACVNCGKENATTLTWLQPVEERKNSNSVCWEINWDRLKFVFDLDQFQSAVSKCSWFQFSDSNLRFSVFSLEWSFGSSAFASLESKEKLTKYFVHRNEMDYKPPDTQHSISITNGKN